MTETPNESVLFAAGANPEPTGLVTTPVTPPVPPGMTVPKVLELIDALARELYDETATAKLFSLSQSELDVLKKNGWFAKAVDTARTQWQKADNVHQRLAIEAALVLEKNLPILSQRLGNKNENLAAIAQLAKLFAEISGNIGLAAANKQPERQERFKIVFNLGADVQEFAASRSMVTIQSDTETSGVPAPLQIDGKGPGN